MVGKGSRHGGRLGRTASSRSGREARMISAEIVDGTDQIHPRVQRGGAPRQGPAPAGECGQTLAEGSIESFNVGSVNHALALRALNKLFDLRRWAGQNPVFDTGHPPRQVMLDDL